MKSELKAYEERMRKSVTVPLSAAMRLLVRER